MKTKYKPDMHPRRAEDLAKAGMTDEEMAGAFGVHVSTLYDWQNRHPEFAEAIKRGKEEPNRQVEAALFKRAIGYDYDSDEVTAGPKLRADGTNEVLKVVRKKVHVPADPTSMIFFLKNRDPKRWRDTFHLRQTFDPMAGLEGISEKDAQEVASAVEHILGTSGGNGNGTGR